jgi:hypothetical protein
MYPGITPEFEKELDDLLVWLQTEVTKSLPKSVNLPWLKHGMRGFFRKLKYGDSLENPDWYAPEEGVVRRPTLTEYIAHQRKYEKEIDSFFKEWGANTSDVIKPILDSFKNRFLVLMSHYLVGGTTTGGDPNKIAQAVRKELPLAVQILNKGGMSNDKITRADAATLATELLKYNLDSLPHIRRAAKNARYHEKLRDLILQQIGAKND